MNEEVRIVANTASFFSKDQIENFIEFVEKGREVCRSNLDRNVPKAECLIFLYQKSILIGTAALKKLDQHRDTVFRNAEIDSPEKYPYELGYIRVEDDEQGKGYSKVLVSEALSQAKGKGVYATSAVSNEAMHRTLEKFNFVKDGRNYDSSKKDRKIQVFLKEESIRK